MNTHAHQWVSNMQPKRLLNWLMGRHEANLRSRSLWRDVEHLENRLFLSAAPGLAAIEQQAWTGSNQAIETSLSRPVPAARSAAVASAVPATGDAFGSFYLPRQYRLTSSGNSLLTQPSDEAPLEIAKQFLRKNAAKLGLKKATVRALEVTDQYTDEASGITHIYFRQQFRGLEIMHADVSVNISAKGQVINASSSCVTNTPTRKGKVKVDAVTAFDALRDELGLQRAGTIQLAAPAAMTPEKSSVLITGGLTLADVPAKLVYVPGPKGLVLAWQMQVQTTDREHWFEGYVRADNAQPIYANDWADHAAYNVFTPAASSPAEGSRTLVSNPADPVASPYGWHDTNGVSGAEFNDTRGNNVFAQEDQDHNDIGGARPSGGSGLNFDFPLDLAQAPSSNSSAAITNLFYWNNLLHDVHYRYGFTEAAGNFQFNNYGKGGLGNDQLIADALDGSQLNNSHFFSTPDGTSPRMEMYLFNYTSPQRDADLDGALITHEYGHGVSGRLTGGPANASALDALQSSGMGEGWSDWWSLMFMQNASDTKLGSYTLGNYILGQSPTGSGFRTHPYSFDMSVDPAVYSDFNGGFPNNESHNTGVIWCSALWDLNWLLIDKYGFSSNLSTGNGGNNLAMQLVMDGLKLQPANPTFISGRDAILAADQALTGGQNQSAIWTAFARRGIGFSATDGGNANAVTVTAAYDLPPSGSISGTVYRDDSGDGTRDISEPGLAGWTVYRDVNNNGIFDTSTTTIFNSTDTPKTIADPGTTYSNLTLSGLWGVVTDVNVTVNLTHPVDGQLYVTLISPGNTPVILSNYQGGSGANFTGTTFDDSATTPIASGTAPFSGSFKPYFDLARLNGSNPNGTWKLRLDDAVAGNVGSIVSWSLQLTYGGAEASTQTDANGNYSFSNVSDGTYHIRQVNQPGYVQTAPATGEQNVVVSGGLAASGRDFGVSPSVSSATPGTPDLVTASDTGSSSSDDLTRLNNASPAAAMTFSIPATVAGALVSLYADGTLIGSATATGSTTLITTNGSFALGDGTRQITARQLEPGKSLSVLSNALAVLIDTTAPGVSINQYVGQADPTSASTIYFTAIFSEPVSDFTSGDVTISGTALANSVVVGSGSTNFNMAVMGMSTSGTVIASIAAGAASDAAGNLNSASTSTDNVVTFGVPAPVISVTGLGVNIPDGASTTSSTDGSSFGAVTQNAAAITHTFTVTNSGSGTLTLGAVTLPSGFVPGSDALLTSLEPGASDTFSVQLDTSVVGSFSGDVSFTTNDAARNPFNFRITGSVNPAVNTKPVITSITDGPDPVLRGQWVTLTAVGAADPDAGDAVDKVEFYRDANGNSALDAGTDTLLGTDTDGSDGWSFLADTTAFPLGTNRYFARAFDGALWSLSVTTTGVVNVPPTITSLDVTPAVNFKGDNIILTASGVADSYPGTVSAVEFYRDVNYNGVIDVGIDSLLGSDTSSSGGWTKTVATTAFPIGNVTVMARVKDNNLAYSNTVVSTVLVDAKPTVGSLTNAPTPLIPGQTQTLTAGSVADADGTVVLTEFYRDANANNVIDPLVDQLLGSDAVGSDGWSITVPGATTANYPIGKLTYLTRVQDNLGAWSTTRSTTGYVSNPPTVGTLTATPAMLNKGATLTLVASDVTDPDAGQTIASVIFYRDSNNSGSWESTDSTLGTDTNSSDGWSWSGSTSAFTSGNVRLFARAKDSVGLSSTVAATTLTYVNSLPVVTVTSTALNYTLGSAATLVASTATVTDSNSLNFDTGSLLVQFTSGTGKSDDRLTIRNQGTAAGLIAVSGNSVLYGGTLIGTWTGGTDGTTPLLISFNAAATPAAAQAVARNILFQSVAPVGTVSATGVRTVSFTIDDGDGGQSLPGVRTINVA